MAAAEPATGTTLRITRVIEAPRERVFEAWTRPDQVAQWFGGPVGHASSAELDVRVGGSFRIKTDSRVGSETWYCVGTYLVVEPPERLVCTFGWEGTRWWDLGESLLTVEFRDLGKATEVDLTHERNRTRPVHAFHRIGWGSSLRQLAQLVGR
jgi:uncharacterized protein YndB with AHSA1/START domain